MSDPLRYVTATPELLDGWSGPAEEWVLPGAHSFNGHWGRSVLLDGKPYPDAYTSGRTFRLDAHRPEVMHRIVDLARAGGGSSPTPRPPADLTLFLPIALGGPIKRIDHAAAMLVRSWERMAAGLGAVRGVLVYAGSGRWHGAGIQTYATRDEAIAGGFALLDADGGLTLPPVTT